MVRVVKILSHKSSNHFLHLKLLFERENRDLEAVMIRELLDLVSRCDRVLSAPGGSLLLAGRSGVGRRTAVSIVAALHQV